MSRPLTLFILGGYGTFGGRIVELLEGEPGLTLIIAGRSLAKAQAFSKSRSAAIARLVSIAFDRNGDIGAQLAPYRPDILIDASGPFQAYGESRYRVIEACLAKRIPYLDLADGSDFVDGVSAYDQAARDAGIYVLSGVSSFPVLTAAAVRRLSGDMTRVDTIYGGIAPSPFAGVGLNVIRAIAGYAGQPTKLKRDGKATKGFPLTDVMRYTVRPPGRLPLGDRLFSLVDVPDLRALEALWPEARTIWMGAGPVPEILHRVLIMLAWLVRWKLAPGLAPLAPLMHVATNHLRRGENRGGMFVEIEGISDQGAPKKRSWHLLAEGRDGPLIPAMAVEALVRRALDGHTPEPGARAATRDLEVEDYEKLFAARQIFTGVWDETSTEGMPLFARLLGSAYATLPAEIQVMHKSVRVAEGRAHVERGSGWVSRLAGRLINVPRAASDIPIQVRFEPKEETEIWTRRFGAALFRSRMSLGRARSTGLLIERFGPLAFAMALVPEGECLKLIMRGWSAFGVPLPKWLCPRSNSYESVEDGLFRFHVAVSHPLCGLIVKYEGWLKPIEKA